MDERKRDMGERMSPALGPCPFCGSGVRFLEHSEFARKIAREAGQPLPPMVECPSCRAMVSFDEPYASVMESEAAKAYNARAGREGA